MRKPALQEENVSICQSPRSRFSRRHLCLTFYSFLLSRLLYSHGRRISEKINRPLRHQSHHIHLMISVCLFFCDCYLSRRCTGRQSLLCINNQRRIRTHARGMTNKKITAHFSSLASSHDTIAHLLIMSSCIPSSHHTPS